MLISVELMLNGAGLALVASARLTPASDELGQLGTLLVMGSPPRRPRWCWPWSWWRSNAGHIDSDRLSLLKG